MVSEDVAFTEVAETSVYTVSQLNQQIKEILEFNYPYLWVKGEISNFRVPASGHYYFTLKDEHSQIRAVFFRPKQRNLRFEPEDGLQVLCQGRLSVYEPRGEYQLIVDRMEPRGLGALQLAFEQLKQKLETEGLFDPDSKLPLPVCPQRVAIVTSLTGAAIRDILKIFQHCPYPIAATLLPVRVQGSEAAGEIASAIRAANALAGDFRWDVIIVGRGGGSLEDLWPFNEEKVARAIHASHIPIISAVGHEIDFTISDMVADSRAPTPTAAAQWVVDRLESFQRQVSDYHGRMRLFMARKIQDYRQKFEFLKRRLPDPKRRLEDMRLYVDDHSDRFHRAFTNHFERLRSRFSRLEEKLYIYYPLTRIEQHRAYLNQRTKELIFHYRKILDKCDSDLQRYTSQLESLNPLSVLARGYSITYRLPDEKIVRRPAEVQSGQSVRIRLAEGTLECIVQRTE
jgi:exodeoxyribonuclease VII large subunit